MNISGMIAHSSQEHQLVGSELLAIGLLQKAEVKLSAVAVFFSLMESHDNDALQTWSHNYFNS